MLRWILGLAVSLGMGWYATEKFLSWLRAMYDVTKPEGEKTVPPWLTGLIERLSFTVAVAFNLAGTAPAMIGWIAVKMASHWTRRHIEHGPGSRFLVFSALLAGLVSMFFALLGGLIARGQTGL